MSPKARVKLFRRPAALIACRLARRSPAGRGARTPSSKARERGIPPIDSTGNFEIIGIEVDVGGKDAEQRALRGLARRPARGLARRSGRKTHNRPVSQAPNLSDSMLDGLVVSDRRRAGADRAEPLHRRRSACCSTAPAPASCSASPGQVRRSAPMLLIPVHDHRRTGDQLRIAQPVAARLGAVPHRRQPDRLCPGQRARASIRCCSTPPRRGGRGRGWWRSMLDQYGAADMSWSPRSARPALSRRAGNRACSPRASGPTAAARPLRAARANSAGICRA